MSWLLEMKSVLTETHRQSQLSITPERLLLNAWRHKMMQVMSSKLPLIDVSISDVYSRMTAISKNKRSKQKNENFWLLLKSRKRKISGLAYFLSISWICRILLPAIESDRTTDVHAWAYLMNRKYINLSSSVCGTWAYRAHTGQYMCTQQDWQSLLFVDDLSSANTKYIKIKVIYIHKRGNDVGLYVYDIFFFVLIW